MARGLVKIVLIYEQNAVFEFINSECAVKRFEAPLTSLPRSIRSNAAVNFCCLVSYNDQATTKEEVRPVDWS